MTLFQCLSIPMLGLFILFDLWGLWARRGRPFIRIGRTLVTSAAIVLILMPNLTSVIAKALGIGRGTDLLLYIMLLALPMAWFKIQTDKLLMERRLVSLARAEALRNPVHGDRDSD